MKLQKFLYCFVLAPIMLLWACTSTRLGATPTLDDESPILTLTEMPEEVIVATEHSIQTQNALTRAVLPTATFMPTLTPTRPIALLPTLTPIPNSTPAGNGAYFDVPSDVLGSQYEIENAYYFDVLQTGERYEFYKGAVAGSGDEETAQGVMFLRVLRYSEQGSNSEVISTEEYLTPIQAGPLRIAVDFTGSIILFTPLHFEWTFFVRQREMVDLKKPPLARLEIGEAKQLAGRGSFCWSGNCLDGPGISTSNIPLVLQSPDTAHLHLPLVEPPDSLRLYSIAISPSGSLEYDSISELEASWSYETPGRELLDQGPLALRRDQDIKLFLKPGYYILVVMAAWRDYGDVKYGFLIEVQE